MTKREFERQVRQVVKPLGAGQNLTDVLAIADDVHFVIALERYLSPGPMPWEDVPSLPPEPRLVICLNALSSAVFSSGISAFLIDMRVIFEDALAACETIGAARVAAYLRAVPSCFPDGRLPASGDECGDLIIADEGESEIGRCLRDLDARHRGAIAEIPPLLRRHVFEHAARFETHREIGEARKSPSRRERAR